MFGTSGQKFYRPEKFYRVAQNLQVSLYDTKATIIERADDLSFADPDREKIFAQARDILLNPRKRIAAEIRWFVGCSRRDEEHIADCFMKNNHDFKFEGNISWLAVLHYHIYEFEKEIWPFNELDVSFADSKYSILEAEEIREQINAARKISKFPAVQDTAAGKDELKNIRYEIREKFQGRLKEMSYDERVNPANEINEAIVLYEKISASLSKIFSIFTDLK